MLSFRSLWFSRTFLCFFKPMSYEMCWGMSYVIKIIAEVFMINQNLNLYLKIATFQDRPYYGLINFLKYSNT